MSRRILLHKAVLVILVLIPLLLTQVVRNDNLALTWPQGIGWLVDGVWIAMLVGSLLGSVRAASAQSAVYLLMAIALIVGSFFVSNGPYQLAAAGLSCLGVAIVSWLLSGELEAQHRVHGSADQIDHAELG